MISLLIFTLALFTLLGTIGQFTRSAHADKQQLRMDLFARELLDQVRAAVGESNFATEGFFVAFSTSNYTLGTFPGLTATRGIGPFMGNGTRLVTVTISGRSGGAPMERTYQLLLTRSDVAGGGVNVPVRVVEAYPISETAVRETTRGVVNANVRYPRADLEGDWRSQTTDDNGDVILRNVLISSSVVLRVYKYGVTPDVQFSTDTRIQRINQGYYWLGDSSEHQETVDTRRYLREDQQTPVPIALIPLGHVRGQVVDPATDGGGPVPGATVRLYTPSHYGLSVDTTVPAGPWRCNLRICRNTTGRQRGRRNQPPIGGPSGWGGSR
ncbi:MAG: hypothetical protein HYZ73_00480 [Elusimicrobia bacterium]|nr:hypothetical protein [Elusimicrobiota bacterium]